MTKSIQSQVAFSGGEWSPLMDMRVDHPKYKDACRQLQNMIALKQGGARRRPGLIQIGVSKYTDSVGHSYGVRLMKFQFSTTTKFVLEFGHHYVRFYSNFQQVSVATAPTWVSQLYAAGSYVIDPSNGLMYYLYSTVSYVSNIPPHSLPAAWVQQTILEQPTPYSGDAGSGSVFDTEIYDITLCQINDVTYLVHPNYPPYKLTRYSDTNWVMEQVQFITPALLDQNTTNTTIQPTQVSGNGVLFYASAPAWQPVTAYDESNTVLAGGVIYHCNTP